MRLIRYTAATLIVVWVSAPVIAPLLTMLPGLQGVDALWRRHPGVILLVWAVGVLLLYLGIRSAAKGRTA